MLACLFAAAPSVRNNTVTAGERCISCHMHIVTDKPVYAWFCFVYSQLPATQLNWSLGLQWLEGYFDLRGFQAQALASIAYDIVQNQDVNIQHKLLHSKHCQYASSPCGACYSLVRVIQNRADLNVCLYISQCECRRIVLSLALQ